MQYYATTEICCVRSVFRFKVSKTLVWNRSSEILRCFWTRKSKSRTKSVPRSKQWRCSKSSLNIGWSLQTCELLGQQFWLQWNFFLWCSIKKKVCINNPLQEPCKLFSRASPTAVRKIKSTLDLGLIERLAHPLSVRTVTGSFLVEVH